MSDDLVKRICKTWIEDGRSDDCFWERWPEDPTPDDSLTPGMVLARIEELEARLAQYRALYEVARYEVRDRETKLEELEELLMDVVDDLRDGVPADKIDYRIGKVILRMDQ